MQLEWGCCGLEGYHDNSPFQSILPGTVLLCSIYVTRVKMQITATSSNFHFEIANQVVSRAYANGIAMKLLLHHLTLEPLTTSSCCS